MKQILRALVSSSCILLANCSFIFSQGPPIGAADVSGFICSTSYAPPILDTVAAGLNVVTLGAGLTVANNRHFSNVNQPAFIVGQALSIGAWTASAVYGYITRDQCEVAQEAWRTNHPERVRVLNGPRLGCQSDGDCKGQRVCIAGSCADSPMPAIPKKP
jgi:hypothetical protein